MEMLEVTFSLDGGEGQSNNTALVNQSQGEICKV